jgi:uncharacterized protein YutE (UPF0331/DUF86 family)/predicted nucleotidyltransferase
MNLFEKQSQLNQLFSQNPVNAAYLSGSLSNRTTFGHLRDIDVAILLMDQIKKDQFFDYQLYFMSELTKRLESDSIDVVILNQSSLLLKLQVIKYGQILFSRNEKQRVSFETRAVMDYLDFQKLDDVQNQALSRRLYSQMLPLDKELIQNKLSQLRMALARLEEIKQHTQEEFVADYHIYGLAERYLQLALEACLLICSTIIAAYGLRRAEEHHELLSIVAQQHIIPSLLAYRLEMLVNMREALVRDAEALNRAALYDYIHHHLQDLYDFSTAIEKKVEG